MEKRDYPRVKKLYLISYINNDKGHNLSPISMGRTLDISPSGIRLEVYQRLMMNSVIEMEIGFQEERFSTKGKIARIEQIDEKTYIVGIQFDDPLNILGFSSGLQGHWDNIN